MGVMTGSFKVASSCDLADVVHIEGVERIISIGCDLPKSSLLGVKDYNYFSIPECTDVSEKEFESAVQEAEKMACRIWSEGKEILFYSRRDTSQALAVAFVMLNVCLGQKHMQEAIDLIDEQSKGVRMDQQTIHRVCGALPDNLSNITESLVPFVQKPYEQACHKLNLSC